MTYEEIKARLAKCEFTLKCIKDGSYKNLSTQDLKEKTAKLNILKESYQKMLSEEGRVRTSNSDEAEKLADKGIDVDLVEPEDLKNELEGDTESSAISDLGQNETAKVAKITGKAVVKVQNEMGLGVKSAKAVNITPDSFSIEIIFSTGSEEEYKFRIEDGYLYLDNFEYGGGVFDKKLAPVGIKADGKPLLHQDVINRELKSVLSDIMGNPEKRGDRFKNETMSDKEFQDAKEAERLEKHPERDKIKKIQALIAKERRKKNIKEREYAADKYNVNVYGYQTKYYKICPGAKSFIQDVVDGNYGELNREEVIRLAQLHDVLFLMEMRALKDSSYAAKILDQAQFLSATIKDQVSSMGLPVDKVDYLDGHIEKIKDASQEVKEFLGFGKKKPKLYKHNSTNLFMRYVFMDRLEQEFETYSPRQQAGINNILQAIDNFFAKSDLSKLRDNIGFKIYPTGKKGALKEDNTKVFITIDNPSGLNRTAKPQLALKYVTSFTENFLMNQQGLDVSKGTGNRGVGTTAFDIFIPVKFDDVEVKEDRVNKIKKLINIRKNNETKGAPSGHYFTASGNLVKGRLTKAAREKGARLSDPKDKQRSKVPPVTQYNEKIEDKELPKGKHSVETLQKLYGLIVDKMKELNDLRKEKGGDHIYQGGSEPGKHSVMDHLKSLTKKKKQVVKALDKAVANVGKDQELNEFVGGELEKRNEPLYDKLVPSSGNSDFIEGEILRAINRIVYRFYNDGDFFYKGYGAETAGPAHAFLTQSGEIDSTLRSTLTQIFNKAIDAPEDGYERLLKFALEKILDYIESKEGNYTKSNEDMFNYESEFEDDPYDEEEDDYYDEYEEEEDYYEEGVNEDDDQPLDEDVDVGHQDDEPGMLKSTAYEAATYAAKLYKKLAKYDQFDGEVDFPNWWQSKLILSKDYLSKAFHYLDSEEKQPIIDKLALEGKNEKKRS